MIIRELLSDKPSVVTIEATVPLSAALTIMSLHQIGALVMRGERGCSVRLISERDAIDAISTQGHQALGEAVETLAPQQCMHCDADDRLQDVMRQMNHHRVRHLPVLENGELIGIVSVGDLLKAQLRETTLENGVLHDRALVSAFSQA